MTGYVLSAPAVALWRLATARRAPQAPVVAPSEPPVRPVRLDKPGARG